MQQGFKQLSQALSANIIGQQHLIERLLIALLADGHLLVEGAPGLAKTKAINALADHIEGDFKRIQFTPDLLPGDITGTELYRPEEGLSLINISEPTRLSLIAYAVFCLKKKTVDQQVVFISNSSH